MEAHELERIRKPGIFYFEILSHTHGDYPRSECESGEHGFFETMEEAMGRGLALADGIRALRADQGIEANSYWAVVFDYDTANWVLKAGLDGDKLIFNDTPIHSSLARLLEKRELGKALDAAGGEKKSDKGRL
jgi:hypothetical protein